MSNKIIVCLYTEGATDKVFYDRLLDFIKTKSKNNKFIVDEIKKINIAGIGNYKTKLLNKFEREINISKYRSYKKIVILCYDEDVFDLVNQTPPVDRKQLEKELKGRNIINSSGQETSNSQCIWDKGKPELSSQDYMMNEAVKGFQEDKQNQEEKMSNFISGFKEFMNNHDR